MKTPPQSYYDYPEGYPHAEHAAISALEDQLATVTAHRDELRERAKNAEAALELVRIELEAAIEQRDRESGKLESVRTYAAYLEDFIGRQSGFGHAAARQMLREMYKELKPGDLR